jgi:hypothetical protein
MRAMALPKEPVTLSASEIHALSRKLSDMRHDINNHLSLVVAAIEMIRHKPESAQRMVATLAEQPARIGDAVKKFSVEFDQAMRITRA